MSANGNRRRLRFGAFEADLDMGELRKSGVRIALQEQPFRMLAALLERPGQVVPRDDLRREVWPADTFVGFDRSLNTAALKIRQALGDSATHPRFLETIPRRGYRFVAPVEVVDAPAEGHGLAQPDTKPTVRRRNRRLLAFVSGASAAVLVAGGWLLPLRLPHAPEPDRGWIVRPLTNFPGVESAPAWSPDGRLIAFSRFVPNDANLFVMPLDGRDPVQLTNNPADDMRPRWSPDWRHLAFLSDEGRTKRVCLMPPLGGSARSVADTNIPYLERFADSWKCFGTAPWSPDGSHLLFSRLETTGGMAVWKVHIETNRQVRLTSPPADCDDLLASWSPDGNWIVFARRQSGRASLLLRRAQGGEPRVLLRDGYDNTTPSFSPDSRRVIFESNRAGAQNIWDLEIASGGLRQLTRGPGSDANAVAGPHGGLLFAHHEFETVFHRLDIGTGREERLAEATGKSYQLRYSRDGRRLLYFSDRRGNLDLWLLDPHTESQQLLTEHPAADVGGDWSPDGRQAVFVSDREGLFHLWVTDMEGQRARKIFAHPVLATPGLIFGAGHSPVPRWSPDGRKIGFVVRDERGTALWSVEPDGRNPRQLLPGALGFDWYCDSRRVVYTRDSKVAAGARELCAADLETGQEVILQRGNHLELAAALDGRGVTYVSGASGFNRGLWLLRLAAGGGRFGLPQPLGKPMRLVAMAGGGYPRNGGWSPDGKAIVYTRERHDADIYLIENYK
jgi:Tol biopolymer transport system component/DNA-binding winged helix-turn-helix (wHTH) protein